MFCVDSSWIPVDSGRNPPEFLEFCGIPGFQPESAESGRNQWRNGKYCQLGTDRPRRVAKNDVQQVHSPVLAQ